MYKILNIKGEDYKIEYTIEASLYSDCTRSVTNIYELLSETDDVKQAINSLSDLPSTTLVLFYAGLLEHHGNHPDGDGKVPNINVAKKLAKDFIMQHQKPADRNWINLLNVCMEQLNDDSFFDLMGLSAMMAQEEETNQTE